MLLKFEKFVCRKFAISIDSTKELMDSNSIVLALLLTPYIPQLQEIYPPKIFDFAYVTDGACDVDDIQQTELLMLKVRAAFNDHNSMTCNVVGFFFK